jgi:hypothetical protein
MHAQLGRERQSRHTASADPVRGSSVVAPPVRGRPRKADGPAHRSLAPIPVRYASVDPATQRSTARHGDTRWDRAEAARIAENSQLAGRSRWWWQVLGSNQHRLSRRIYSPSLLPEDHPADQNICRSRRYPAPWPSAMRPWASGVVHGRGGKPTDGAGGSGYADRPPVVVPLTWYCRMLARCRHLPCRRARAGCTGCRGRR